MTREEELRLKGYKLLLDAKRIKIENVPEPYKTWIEEGL